MSATVKETKAQRIERIKREKNPLDILPDLLRYAQGGFEDIAKEDLDVRFRWWGIYTQGDGSGAFGKALPYFMLRIRIPGGGLVAPQVRAIAELSERYGRGVADLTVRQNIQLHWLRLEDIPEVFHQLARVGLNTMAACGDVTRNITGCPLAGVDASEICDASPLVARATQLLVGNREFHNLPRKFKISISGCRFWCSNPEINDVALTAVDWPKRFDTRGRTEPGFSLRVGGGLSSTPHMARRLNAFVHWPQVLPVLAAIGGLFRDCDELRQNRHKARLKFLFLEHGWTPERFLEEIERRSGLMLDPAVEEAPPADPYRDHVGVHRQKQDGFYYAGFSVLRGRITPDQLRAVADMAERCGDGQARSTNMQNLVLVNVPRGRVSELVGRAADAGLPLDASAFWRGTIACTGMEFCKLAVTETKSFAARLVEDLQARLPGYHRHVRINVNGCPNSCGQHWIADIGLQGCKIKSRLAGASEMVDGYEFFLGGAVGLGGGIARRINFRCPAGEVTTAIENALRAFEQSRLGEESFRQFSVRVGDEQLVALLSGATRPVVPDPQLTHAAAGT